MTVQLTAVSTTPPSFPPPESLLGLHSVTWVTNEDIKHYWPQYQPLWYTTGDWPPAGICVTDHNPSGLDIQLDFNALYCPHV